MNPPYDGNLHLKILEHALKFKKDDGILINLSPARWLQDPLWKYKKACDRKRFEKTIVEKLSDVKFISYKAANNLFNIQHGDIGVFTFSNKQWDGNIRSNKCLIENVVDKLQKGDFIASKIIHLKRDEELPPHFIYVLENYGGRPSGLFKPYGYNKRASSTSKDGSFKKDIIQFETKEEAENFYESTQTNFYKTLNFFGRYYTTMNGPSFSFALPYMNDYSKVWTDKDYCEYFNLTKEESEFMCREVDDYRVKDFIEYEEILNFSTN